MPILFITLFVIIFFWQFFIKGLLPVPGDTIIGLYHPFRDLYAKDYSNGVPFKNFLITDPVRQQFPWRELTISIEKRMELPLWNPYNFAGTPLLGNFQSAPFYIFNVLFFIMPFTISWSLIIFFAPLLSGFFLFLYLENLRLSRWASVLGAISFSFSGFFVAWMEWGTITHVALWLPLILLSIDKIFLYLTKKMSNVNPFDKLRVVFDPESSNRRDAERSRSIKYQISILRQAQDKNKKFILWSFVFIFSLASSFLAGHLQIFFYVLVFSTAYIIARWFQYGRFLNFLYVFLIFYILFFILTSIQWIPTLQFILLSARNIDSVGFDNPGWFVPWQNLIQFVAPDFFGNPTTLNYWGVWNYAEFVGYVGIASFVLAIFAMFSRHDKKTLFFGVGFFVSLIFSLPTFIAKIPFILGIPFLETAQPTRLLFLTTFSLVVLAALGFDYFIRSKKSDFFFSLGFVAIIFISLWIFVSIPNPTISSINLAVTKRNLFLPTILFILFGLLICGSLLLSRHKVVNKIIYIIVVGVTIFDLFRFGWKFEAFTKKDYLFPLTKALSFLQKNLGDFRIMSTDSRILPPNFSTIYRLKSIDGYDPLYLLRYGELIAASERKKANIDPPFGFNRIITPHNYDSKIIDLLGVKFILSLSELDSPKLEKVFQEGETRIYHNTNVKPRAFFVPKIVSVKDRQDGIQKMFDISFDADSVAIVEDADKEILDKKEFVVGKARIINYSENKVIVETENSEAGFLVFTDSFYPTWKVKINSTLDKIYRTDYNFRGVIVPKGRHRVEFYNSLI